jgi:hypothetical protein
VVESNAHQLTDLVIGTNSMTMMLLSTGRGTETRSGQ